MCVCQSLSLFFSLFLSVLCVCGGGVVVRGGGRGKRNEGWDLVIMKTTTRASTDNWDNDARSCNQ